MYLCGLLVVRYGYSSYPFIEVADALNAINLGSLNMSTNRDNGFIICIASLSFSFLLQLGKFVSITWKSHKSTLLVSIQLSISFLYDIHLTHNLFDSWFLNKLLIWSLRMYDMWSKLMRLIPAIHKKNLIGFISVFQKIVPKSNNINENISSFN